MVHVMRPGVPYEQVYALCGEKTEKRKYSSTSASINFSKRCIRYENIELITNYEY